MKSRRRADAANPPGPETGSETGSETVARRAGGAVRRLAYGVVIAWIVGWFLVLLVQGICPVP